MYSLDLNLGAISPMAIQYVIIIVAVACFLFFLKALKPPDTRGPPG
jgi:hypothetical protein